MKTLNDYAYKSKIANVLPIQKVLLGLISLALCIGLNSFLVSFFLILIMMYLSVKYAKISIYKYIKLLMIPFSFLLLGILPIIFSFDIDMKNILFNVKFFGIWIVCSKQSFYEGILVLLKAMGAVSCMYFISLNMTVTEFFMVLKKCKIPSLIITLMELIYRYIFILFDEAKKIKIAQQSRLGYENFYSSLSSTGQLIGLLFFRTYQKCDRVYNSLISRGYNGEIVSLEKDYKFSYKLLIDLFVVILVTLFLFLVERRLIF